MATEFPWPLAHGTYLRVYHLARTLAGGGHNVTVLAPAADGDGPAAYADAGITVLVPPAGPIATDAAAAEAAEPYSFDPALAAAVADAAAEADVVVLFRPSALQYAPQARTARCVVADFIDDPLLELRRKLTADLRPRRLLRRLAFASRQRRYERRFLPAVDVATFVSDVDTASFAARHRRGGAAAAVVPNGVDLDYFAPPACDPDAAGPPNVAFLGHLSHPPNANAAAFLLRRVAPLLLRDRPDATITIIGSSPPPAIQAMAAPGIEITGWVEDVRPHLWRATVVMLPMRIGTGIKNKLLEAWAARRAVVGTPLACQGVPARDGENLLIAATPAQLADAARRLIDQPGLRNRVARAGHDTVATHLTWTAAVERLLQLSLPEGRRTPLTASTTTPRRHSA